MSVVYVLEQFSIMVKAEKVNEPNFKSILLCTFYMFDIKYMTV